MNWTNARHFRELEITRERQRRAFYAEALPCESCGEPCQERTLDAESSLMIGTACSCSITVDEPMCPALYKIFVEQCGTVGEMYEATQQHKATCEICTPEPECNCRMEGDYADSRDCELHGRRPIRREAGSVRKERAA